MSRGPHQPTSRRAACRSSVAAGIDAEALGDLEQVGGSGCGDRARPGCQRFLTQGPGPLAERRVPADQLQRCEAFSVCVPRRLLPRGRFGVWPIPRFCVGCWSPGRLWCRRARATRAGSRSLIQARCRLSLGGVRARARAAMVTAGSCRGGRAPGPQSCQPVDLVEAEIEAHYAGVSLSQAEREQVRQAITDDLGERVATAQREIERCQAVLEEAKEQERKLLHMHYEERISGELFDDEQARIRKLRQDVEALIARLSVRYDDIAATLDLALEILSEDLHELYRRADDSIRRLINQGIFNALFVCDEIIAAAELAEPFAALRTLHDAIRALPARAGRLAGPRQRCPANAKSPAPRRDRDPFRVGSIREHLVRRVGLEPTRPFGQGLLRAPRLPFRHRRKCGRPGEDTRARARRGGARQEGGCLPPVRRAGPGRRRTRPCRPPGRGARARRSSPAESPAWQMPPAGSARARSAA